MCDLGDCVSLKFHYKEQIRTFVVFTGIQVEEFRDLISATFSLQNVKIVGVCDLAQENPEKRQTFPLSLVCLNPSFFASGKYGLVTLQLPLFKSASGSGFELACSSSGRMSPLLSSNGVLETATTPEQWRLNHSQKKAKTGIQTPVTTPTLKLSQTQKNYLYASKLQIGHWDLEANKDVRVKINQKKNSFVCTFGDTESESRVRFAFNDISTISFVSVSDEHSTDMLLDLKNPPILENRSLRTSKAMWSPCNDFTQGNALRYKRHKLRFSEGTGKEIESIVRTIDALKEALETRISFFPRSDELTFANVTDRKSVV